jgi:hypothetical protein
MALVKMGHEADIKDGERIVKVSGLRACRKRLYTRRLTCADGAMAAVPLGLRNAISHIYYHVV